MAKTNPTLHYSCSAGRVLTSSPICTPCAWSSKSCRTRSWRQLWSVAAKAVARLAGGSDAQCVLRHAGLQYRSVECLRRNLANNPTLMRVCGFASEADANGHMRVPSKSTFSRFFQLLVQEQDAVMELFYDNRERLMERCPDFGASLGFDGKKLHSYSTGRTRADGTCSDPDAAWAAMSIAVRGLTARVGARR